MMFLLKHLHGQLREDHSESIPVASESEVPAPNDQPVVQIASMDATATTAGLEMTSQEDEGDLTSPPSDLMTRED